MVRRKCLTNSTSCYQIYITNTLLTTVMLPVILHLHYCFVSNIHICTLYCFDMLENEIKNYFKIENIAYQYMITDSYVR